MARTKFRQFAADALGNTVSGAAVEVRDADGNLATLYAAASGATTLSNPMTAGDGSPETIGAFEFWIDQADYGDFDITVGSGLSAETFPVRIGLDRGRSQSSATIAAFKTLAGDGDLDGVPDGAMHHANGLAMRKQTGAAWFSDTSGWVRDRQSTKSRVLDWAGTDVLWLGTSIPHQGEGTDSYPELACKAVGATADNNAWSGSHASFENIADIDPSGNINQIKALSMTDADRVAGLAYHGSGSVFDDAYDPITKASKMTCDHRIATPFASTEFGVVVLDHNHNDRAVDDGAHADALTTISSVTFGATTDVVVADASGISVGDAVGLTSTGVDEFAYAAARVESIASNTLTLGYDTSALAGTVTGGNVYLLDRTTAFGAWEFLIYYIYGQAVLNGYDLPTIILSSAPSMFTNNTLDANILNNSRILRAISDEWSLPFFDVAREYAVDEDDHSIYFSDNVHPATTGERQAIANLWVAWMEGGAPRRHNPGDFIASATATVGGTADAITLTSGQNLSSLVTGQSIRFMAASANTGGTTINVDGLGAVTAADTSGEALSAGYIRTDADTTITYDGTNWVVERLPEFGTFTPVVADADTGGNTGTSGSGYYHRIGNVAHYSIRILNIDTTGMTGANDLWITGLPFQKNAFTFGGFSEVTASGLTFAGHLGIAFSTTQKALRISETVSGAPIDYVIVSEVDSGVTDLYITASHFV